MTVAITGFAVASPFGAELEAFWRGVCHGPTPVSRWVSEPRFSGLVCQAALLPEAASGVVAEDRATELAIDLARRALASAGFAVAPTGAGLALGTHWGNVDVLGMPPLPARPPMAPALARALTLSGPITLAPVACTAANHALMWAVDRVRARDASVMLAGGLDVIGPTAVGGYLLFGNLTETLPRPFSPARDGFLLSEGGALFVLEDAARTRAAGRRVLAEIIGVGAAHDGSHPTRPAVDGRGVRLAIERALADAGLTAADVGYVNAHSPGTQANDHAEAAAYRAVFGPRGVPVSSTKGALGHAQGGANALEAAACLLALRDGLLPPTLNVDAPDPAFAIDLVVGTPRPVADLRNALSVAASIGGATSAVILRKGDAPW
jgi:3-oxoacyl-[acyl-carrier-protein] synthase II